MHHGFVRFVGCVGLMLTLTATLASAQEFILPYVKTPETPKEFWAAVKYEVELGNYRRGAERLKEFWDRLGALPEDEQRALLLNLHDTDGMSWFLRLANIADFKKVTGADAAGKERPVADLLVDRVGGMVNQRLGDPGRIKFFMENLNKSPEERNYALVQLRQSGPKAMPYMMEALRTPGRSPQEQERILSALVRMNSNVVPPLLACLDAKDPLLRTKIINVLTARADQRAVPHLWYLSESKDQPEAARKEAQQALEKFLKRGVRDDEEAKAKCVREAERFYKHLAEPARGDRPVVYRWSQDEGLTAQPVTQSQWEEYYGVYWSKKALDLDPAYRPAQVVLMSVALDKALERGGVELPLAQSAPTVQALLPAASGQLLEDVLNRALAEKRTGAALGATRALAANVDAQATAPRNGQMAPLVRALSYPDRRVQLAAADAILVNPSDEPFSGSSRVVDVLSRALDVAGTRRAIIGHPNAEEAHKLAAQLRGLGFEPEIVTNGRQLVRNASGTGDVELIVVHSQLMDPALPTLLGQLRGGVATASIPVLVLSPATETKQTEAAVQSYANVVVASPPPVSNEMVKHFVGELFQGPFQAPLSDAEKKVQAELALYWLGQLSQHPRQGYGLAKADAALTRALEDDNLVAGAANVLSQRPGRQAQDALAGVVLNASRTPLARAAAARGLRFHLVRHGSLLRPEQANELVKLAGNVQDPAFRGEAMRLATSLARNVAGEGAQLRQFEPNLGKVPVADEEKK